MTRNRRREKGVYTQRDSTGVSVDLTWRRILKLTRHGQHRFEDRSDIFDCLVLAEPPAAGRWDDATQRSEYRQILDRVHVVTTQDRKLQRHLHLHQVHRAGQSDANQRRSSWTEAGKYGLLYAAVHFYSALDRRAEYCDKRVCLCVCLSAIISSELRVRSSPTLLHVTYGRGSVLLFRRSDTLCTSSFIDDVIFAHKPGLHDVADHRKRSAHAALGLAIICAQ